MSLMRHKFPLPQQAESARGSRRIGLGITGLADALLMLGLAYGSEASLAVAAEVMRFFCHTAYRASVTLAQEKGPFPYFDREKYPAGASVQSLADESRQQSQARAFATAI
jgi:ribonucleoside-diphosphate reductase alpha chain